MNEEEASEPPKEAGGEDDEELYYEDFEDEKYGNDGAAMMIDPAALEGTSYGQNRPAGSQEEQDYLTAEIGEYLTSMSARRDDGHYQVTRLCGFLSVATLAQTTT